jgi:hypothetical protein
MPREAYQEGDGEGRVHQIREGAQVQPSWEVRTREGLGDRICEHMADIAAHLLIADLLPDHAEISTKTYSP